MRLKRGASLYGKLRKRERKNIFGFQGRIGIPDSDDEPLPLPRRILRVSKTEMATDRRRAIRARDASEDEEEEEEVVTRKASGRKTIQKREDSGETEEEGRRGVKRKKAVKRKPRRIHEDSGEEAEEPKKGERKKSAGRQSNRVHEDYEEDEEDEGAGNFGLIPYRGSSCDEGGMSNAGKRGRFHSVIKEERELEEASFRSPLSQHPIVSHPTSSWVTPAVPNQWYAPQIQSQIVAQGTSYATPNDGWWVPPAGAGGFPQPVTGGFQQSYAASTFWDGSYCMDSWAGATSNAAQPPMTMGGASGWEEQGRSDAQPRYRAEERGASASGIVGQSAWASEEGGDPSIAETFGFQQL
jgi:hypothetical protein